MALFDEEILYEKEINISKDSEEKSNSLFIKSLNEGEINLMDILKDKLLLLVTISKNKNIINLANESIFKILKLYKNENMESIVSDYITFNVIDDNISYKEDFPLNNNQDNSIGILDAPFVKLLEITKNYKININLESKEKSTFDGIKKELLNNNEFQKDKIDINVKSMKKICKFLNKSIYDISDYINILVLFLNNDDINKAQIQNIIIDKYSKSGLNEYFMGKKNFEINLRNSIKVEKNNIYKMDDLFENILNKIDYIENNSSEEMVDDKKDKINDNEDLVETTKKFIEQKIKINKLKYDNKDDIDNNDDFDNDAKRKCNCQKDVCSFCSIF